MTRPLALVAGASSGIGEATARALAEHGHHVHLVGRREPLLRDLAAALAGTYSVADLSDPEQLARTFDDVQALGRPVSVAVYAAGTLHESPVADHPVEIWEATLAINLTGPFLFAREVTRLLEPGSRVIFVSSVSARKGARNLAAYSASKSGLDRLAEAFAAEHERDGIGVHVIAPGPVATPMLDRPGVSPFQLQPERVADVVVWLAQLPPDTVIRTIEMRAVMAGPFADSQAAKD